LIGSGTDEEQYWHNSRISLEQLCQTTLKCSGASEFLKQMFAGVFEFKDVTSFGFSQQFEAQRSLPDKGFYVEGYWRCNFHFCVERQPRELCERSG